MVQDRDNRVAMEDE